MLVVSIPKKLSAGFFGVRGLCAESVWGLPDDFAGDDGHQVAPAHRPVMKGGVFPFAEAVVSVESPFLLWVEDGDVSGFADGEVALV